MSRKIILSKVVLLLVILMMVTLVQAQALQAYVVQSGDTLQNIAARFNVTVEAIITVNSLPNPNQVFVGQVIFIPPPAPPPPVPSPTPTPIPLPPNPGDQQVYTVVSRDTLARIAARFGVTINAILQVNNIPNPNLIYVGQQIVIPAPGSPPPPPPPAPPPTPVPPPVASPPFTVPYVVQLGDTLSEISLQFLVGMEGIRQQNNIVDNRRIFPNQILFIPQPGNVFYTPYYDPYPVVQPPPAPPPAPPTTPPVAGQFYVVQPGDTLRIIANRFGKDMYDIARANGILNLNIVVVGQTLRIP